MDPLSLLIRKDKWFLGGGKGALYAPPFPRHLTSPGFWDESYFADIRLTRLFTVLFTDSEGRPIRLRSHVEEWRPDRMILLHLCEQCVIREFRCLTEGNAWVSRFALASGPPLYAFVWSLPETREAGFGTPWQSLADVSITPSSLGYEWRTAWPAQVEADRTGVEDERALGGPSMLSSLPVFAEIGSSSPRLSYTVNLAQRHDDSPLWETSVLPQKLRGGRLAGDEKIFVGPPPVEGLVHLVQQYEIGVDAPLTVACGVGPSAPSARSALEDALAPGVLERCERDWRAYFASVPQFSSSDPFLTNAYWYRWYGLRLNTVDVPGLPLCGDGPLGPFITEGVGFFRNFVTYSAQAHLREVSWMRSPRLALGILENLRKSQREDGSFPGHSYSCRPARDFYHADFATGVLQLRALHPTVDLEATTASLKGYAEYLLKYRKDTNGILVFDQNETGQEYMSRYAFAATDADEWAEFRVVGVDATFYAYLLLRALRELSPDDFDESDYRLLWPDRYVFLLQSMQGLFDRNNYFFCDLLPSGTAYSPMRPATGLYPAMCLPEWISRGDAVEVFAQWLTDERQFWLPKGFPATAKSDPTFSADGEWKEKRLNCPWSGRSWPMANSHLVDAAAALARKFGAEEMRAKAGEALMKAVRLMFHDGDPERPNSYEHYDPLTGTPSLYRGYDDYMHSWIVDLILRHAVGVQPGQDELDPLPLDVDWIECSDIPHPKGRMRVRIERGRVVGCAFG